MGSRDRPAKEVKKKPKDKSSQPKLAPLSESPQQAELIKKAAQAPARDGFRRGLTPPSWDRVPLRRVG